MLLKVGVIGLGDIATKAYLPLLGRANLEVHLFTRNEEKLRELSAHYRFTHSHTDLGSLIHSGIKAAFVHSATASHAAIVEELLENDIHVYVDKPVTYDYESTAKLVALAERRGILLMAGFNRRYAPAYAQLKSLQAVNMILMQKNRKSLPGDIRTFIFDDFIHVVDTLLFLFPHEIGNIAVTGRKTDDILHHVVVQFSSGNGVTAIGMMNRDSGTVEERLEVFTPAGKWVVSQVTESAIFQEAHVTTMKVNDWQSTLQKRGFEQITAAFINAVAGGAWSSAVYDDLLRTHQLCERVVQRLVAL